MLIFTKIRSVYWAEWAADPFAPKFCFLVQNNIGPNFDDGLIIVTCKHSFSENTCESLNDPNMNCSTFITMETVNKSTKTRDYVTGVPEWKVSAGKSETLRNVIFKIIYFKVITEYNGWLRLLTHG